MNWICKSILTTLVLFGSLAAVADLPYIPPTPEEVCKLKKEGDNCSAEGRGGWIANGVCKYIGSCLECSPRESLRNLVKAEQVIDNKESDEEGKDSRYLAEEEAVQTQGCSNIALMPTSLFSLFSVVLGLFIVARSRRK